jgi:hypothetical protein
MTLTKPATQRSVVEGLFALGSVGLLVSPPTSGKTTLATMLAYKVTQGAPVFGLATTQGPVVYFGWWGDGGTLDRYEVLRRRFGKSAARLDILFNLCDFEGEDKNLLVSREVVCQKQPALVVVDTYDEGWHWLERRRRFRELHRVLRFARAVARGNGEQAGPAVLLVHSRPNYSRLPREFVRGVDVLINLEMNLRSGVATAIVRKSAYSGQTGELSFRVEEFKETTAKGLVAVEVSPFRRVSPWRLWLKKPFWRLG